MTKIKISAAPAVAVDRQNSLELGVVGFFNLSELRTPDSLKAPYGNIHYKLIIDGDIFLFSTTSSIPPEMSSPASYLPHSMHDLSGRVALVTGGGTGIGLMCSQGLAACGAKVYITGRRLDVLEKVSVAWDKQIGGEILPYVDQSFKSSIPLLTPISRLQMDVTDKESILKVKTYIEAKEGKLHVLVNKFVRSIYSWVGYWRLTLYYTQRGTGRSHFALSQR